MSLRAGVLLVILVVLACVFYWYGLTERWPTNSGHGPNVAALPSVTQSNTVASTADLSVQLFPGRVVNSNGSLDHFSGLLENLCGAWADDLGIDLQIVAVDLADQSINEFATTLFEERGLGETQPNGGLLILLDGSSGQARIEVSYELEPAFPDAFVGRLADDQLAPYAASKLAGMAIMDTVHYLKDFAFIRAAAGHLPKSELITQSNDFKQKLAYLSGGAGATVDIAELVTASSRIQPVSVEEEMAYAPGETPELSVAAIKRVWADLVPNPDLELYTPGSRVLNSRYPYAPFEVAERLRRTAQAGELRTIVQDDFAVVTSDEPVHGFTPILLRKIGGYWRVDLTETWKNLFFDEKGNYYQKNNNNPYAFGLARFGDGDSYPIQALELNEKSLPDLMRRLEARDDALAHFELAELLFRNGFAALASLDHYEKAIERAPSDPLFRSILADRYLYLGFAELAVPHLDHLGEAASVRLAQAYAFAGDFEKSEEAARTILAGNHYSYHGTAWLDFSLKMQKRDHEKTSSDLQQLLADSQQKMRLVRTHFNPAVPVFDNESAIDVNGTMVYGHSNFSVLLTNSSERPVQIESVQLTSKGTGHPSGLGDIKDYWSYSDAQRTLQAGEVISFDKKWGFTVKTDDQRMSYVFRICWRGVADTVSQCEAQILHLSTRSSVFPVE